MHRIPARGPAFVAAQGWAVLVALILLGCSRDHRETDTRQCIAQAEGAALPGPPPGESDEERHDRIGAEVAVCMEQRGYRHDNGTMADAQCVDDVDYNAHCYSRRD
jgi:hypothetical protein